MSKYILVKHTPNYCDYDLEKEHYVYLDKIDFDEIKQIPWLTDMEYEIAICQDNDEYDIRIYKNAEVTFVLATIYPIVEECDFCDCNFSTHRPWCEKWRFEND